MIMGAVGAGWDRGGEKLAELGIGASDTGGTVILLQVVPDLLHSSQVQDRNLD